MILRHHLRLLGDLDLVREPLVPLTRVLVRESDVWFRFIRGDLEVFLFTGLPELFGDLEDNLFGDLDLNVFGDLEKPRLGVRMRSPRGFTNSSLPFEEVLLILDFLSREELNFDGGVLVKDPMFLRKNFESLKLSISSIESKVEG